MEAWMTDTDTSAEFVEALIDRHRLVASTWRMTVSDHELTAATLRALLAERDAERVAREHWQSQVQSTVQSLLKAEAERDGALGLAKRHMDEKHRTERQAAEDWDVLQQRIKTAEAERDEAIQRGNDWCDQARTLRGERDRLREALRYWLHDDEVRDFGEWFEAGCKIARAALKEPGL
jgi:chromosome segregation ATPase